MAKPSQDPSVAALQPAEAPADTPGGVRVRVRENAGRTRTLVRDALLLNPSLKGVARALGLNRKTVQEHADSLLLAGVLVRAKRGTGYGWSKGPNWGGEGGCGVQPASRAGLTSPHPAPPRVDEATDGARTFTVMRPPDDVTRLPGFLGSKPKGKGRAQLVHAVRFTVKGRTFGLQLNQTIRTNVWGLTVGRVSPPVPFADFQVAGEDPDDAWDRFVVAAVEEWTRRTGVGVDLTPRRTRRVSVTYRAMVQPGVKWRSAPSDADESPPDETRRAALELRGQELQEFVNEGPEFRRYVLEEMRANRALLKEVVATIGAGAVVSAGLARDQAVLLGQAATIAPAVAARTAANLCPPSPWEHV